MKFERQVRRRLIPEDSKSNKHIERDVPKLKPGEGTLLPSGEIVLNHPEQGIIMLRASHAYVYTPVKESNDPLDNILGKPEAPVVLAEEEDSDPEPEDIPKASDDEEPLIKPEDLKDSKPDTGEPGAVTGGAGFMNSSY